MEHLGVYFMFYSASMSSSVRRCGTVLKVFRDVRVVVKNARTDGQYSLI